MKYKTKSIIIGRKKGEEGSDTKPCFIALFDVNDPHKKNVVPKEIIEYDKVHKIMLKNFDVNYLLPGNDLVINDLKFIQIEKEGPHITIKGKQAK
ncbi:MAG: hypothetical protein Q8O03_04030 [Nanoarchaeota archaeon]|nr:hypothetical protein [Nanoarchaeota archaeon]